MKTPPKRLLVPATVVLLAVMGLTVWWLLLRQSPLPEGLIQANGRIEGDHYLVAGKMPGRVAELLAQEGDTVQKGQVLLRLDAAQHRGAAAFVLVGMRLLADDVFVPSAAMGHQGAQIGLGAGREEQARLLAGPLRDDGLQAQHRGIVAPDIVAHFGREHRLEHARRRAGYGVAAQIDHGGAFLACSRSCKARHCTLPVADFGSASMNSTMRGYL